MFAGFRMSFFLISHFAPDWIFFDGISDIFPYDSPFPTVGWEIWEANFLFLPIQMAALDSADGNGKAGFYGFFLL